MTEKSIFDLDPDQLDRLLSIGADADKEQSSNKQEAQADQGRVASEGGSASSGPQQSGDPTASLASVVERPGGWIGQYKLLSVLGEGGMGIVYLAEQERPIKRRVALKIIKPGMDSKRIIARFEAERQALALLDHSNIAHVYDAGTTKSGRPYFVMEYVKGLSITEYCDHHKLTIEERLRLFRQICLAVHHAHQKGIIHRDIKPSNILVSMQDKEAVPKIIDFGVAKALSMPLTERTLATEDSQLLGTPEYMSPEQADMANEDIDTRSDIYSLGVLLYVLLTGVLPFDSNTLRTGGIEHIRQIIRETDPKTPSTRLSKLGEEGKKVAQSRRTEIATLTKKLHKELEWIPLKAMRKERAERYRSASEFADDIKNYLKGEPLIAGPPTTMYRLKKFVRRNSVLAGGIVAVLSVLAGGIIVSTFFAIKAHRQAKVSQSIADFFQSGVMGEGHKRPHIRTRGLLDGWSRKLEGKFINEPLIEATIRETLGWTYRNLGYIKEAKEHLEHSLRIRQQQVGLEHTDTLSSMFYLGWAYLDEGRFHEAEQLWATTLEARRRIYGEEHRATLESMNALAVSYAAQDNHKEAESIYLKVLEKGARLLGEEDDIVLFSTGNLADLNTRHGRYEDAEQLFLKMLPTARRIWGKEDKWTLFYTVAQANLYRDLGRYEVAERLYVTTLEAQRRLWGDNEALFCTHNLAMLYKEQGDYDKAEPLFLEALKGRRLKLGDTHPHTIESLNNLIDLYEIWNKPEKAKEWRANLPKTEAMTK